MARRLDLCPRSCIACGTGSTYGYLQCQLRTLAGPGGREAMTTSAAPMARPAPTTAGRSRSMDERRTRTRPSGRAMCALRREETMMSVLGPLQRCAVCGVRTRRTVTWHRQRVACCPACTSGSLAPPAILRSVGRQHAPRTGGHQPAAGGRPWRGPVRDLLRCLMPSPPRILGKWRP